MLFRGKIEKVDLMEAVFTIDESGKIVSCNHNFVQSLFGYTNTELLGQSITTLIPNLHQNTGGTDIFGSGEPERKKTEVRQQYFCK
jgi:PAS domain S-box-containing protein